VERIPFTCTLDCGSRCELVACVENGRLVRIDTPAGRPDSTAMPRLVPCLRGRAHRRALNAPERLLHPMVHSGPRGAGSWAAASWDEALDVIATRLRETLAKDGAAAILHATGAGALSGRGISGAEASRRFFSFLGPVTGIDGNMSVHNVLRAHRWMVGRHLSGSDRATLLESRLIVLWGNNPAETQMGPNTAHFVAEARDRGARIVLVDPRYTDTGVLADEWIPLRPGTDAALAAAMAWVILSDGLEDAGFLGRCVSGLEDYRAYVLGEDGGDPRTPEWAEPITGVSAAAIRSLARRYATDRPAALLAGWGPQRTVSGEQSARALISLACLSGNVGLCGGGLGGYGGRSGSLFDLAPLPWGPYAPGRMLPPGSWAPAILGGRLEPPPRVLYVVASNLVNRSQESLACVAALAQVPFVVVQDPFFTPTARQADLVLPASMEMERADLVTSWGHDAHLFDSRQALAPAGEAKSDYWVMSRLAERLGIGQAYTRGRDEAAWLDEIRRSSPLPWDAAREAGILRCDPAPRVELADYRQNPDEHALSTRSGRIELSNPEALDVGLPLVAAYVPQKAPAPDYPLQLLTPHHKARSNSCLAANPWLQRVEPHAVWINPADAAPRNITEGVPVRVSAPGGVIRIRAYVTERIMPGVVSVAHGAWMQLGDGGIDEGGCANTLTATTLSPTGGPTTHSNWVQVEREDARP